MRENNKELKIYKRGDFVYAENITGINPNVSLIVIGGNNSQTSTQKEESIKDEKD